MAGSQFNYIPTVVEVEFDKNGQPRPVAFTWQGQVQHVADLGRTWHERGTQYWLVMTPAQSVFEIRLQPDGGWQVRQLSEQPVMA